MIIKNIKIRSLIFVLVISAVVFVVMKLSMSAPVLEQTVKTPHQNTINQENNQPNPFQAVKVVSDQERFFKEMVAQLQLKHASDIHQTSVMVTMKDFRDFVLEMFPNVGMSLFEKIMLAAFPDVAMQILNLIKGLDVYDAWYLDNLLSLNELHPLQKNGKIRAKRHEIFGELAQEIWQQEVAENQKRQDTIRETIKLLDKAQDISLDESLYVLNNTIQEQYSDRAESLIIDKGLVASMYFNLASVQKGLQNLPEEDRQNQINQSRRQLGYNEKTISYLEQQDAQREQRWKNGYQYMQARTELMNTVAEAELEDELSALREQYFKHEAPTIKAEEQGQFFRYERPRLYGQN